MTRDELKTLLTEQGGLMALTRIQGYEAEHAIAAAQEKLNQAADAWAQAAQTLIETGIGTEDAPVLTADEQYQCFIEGCALAGVDSDHPALEEERDTFAVMQAEERSGNPELN